MRRPGRARETRVFTAVFVWAALGIALQTTDVSAAVQVVAATACAASVCVVLALLALPARRRGFSRHRSAANPKASRAR